jgi:hypothetical protein
MTDMSKMREMARGLVRESIMEDAMAQFLAQTLAFVHDERIKPLQERLNKLEAEKRQRIDGVMDRTGDDIVAKLERLATKAETSKTYVQEFRMMRAEGVCDIILEAMDEIVDLRAQLFNEQEAKKP